MQGPLSWAVLINRETNEIKEARSFALSKVEGFWFSCLWRLLGTDRERIIWETKFCPSLFLCYYTHPRISAIPMISAITCECMTSTSISRLMLQTSATNFQFDIFIWIAHRKCWLSMLKDELTNSLKLPLPLHFLYNDSKIHLVTPKRIIYSFTHWSEKEIILLHTLYWAMFSCHPYRN